MNTVTKRELNQQTAAVLASVRAGEAVVVTERGEPRWKIEAFDATPDVVEQLRRDGRIRAAKPVPTPWPDNQQAHPSYDEVDRLFQESRGEH